MVEVNIVQKTIPAQRITKTLDLEKGDLVMLNNDRRPLDRYYLGVFNEIRRDRKWGAKSWDADSGGRVLSDIVLDSTYTLKICEEFGGLIVPVVESSSKNGRRGQSVHSLEGNRINEFYVGVEDICLALRGKDGFSMHAGWVSKLEKPYLR